MHDKLSVYSLEELRISLIKKRNNSTFPHLLIVDYNNFFQSALKFNNVNVAEAFLEEFINEYKYAVSQIESFGSDIEYISNILNSLKEIYLFQNLFSPISFLENEIERIEKEISKLKNILDGKDQNVSSERKATFPLIYKNNSNGFYGIIESATINIKKSSSENKFIIIPSEKNIEENILTQCKNSWELALNLSKRFVKKIHDFHEVIISFDKKEGFYEGNSLGTAITFSFLEEILKYYNPTYTVNLIGNIAFTCGVETNGEILNTGKEIIEQKINTLFFSDTKVFVFHKDDEIFARKRLNELNEKYQNRKLKLEPFDNIDSILNRRDLVDIKKQKLIVRSLKFVKKNWVSSVATIVLAILLAFVFVADWDDNPAILDVSANTLFVKNKSGKVLWTKKMNFNTVIMNLRLLKKSALLVDINNDAINEVILINEPYSEIYKKNDFTKIVCFDKTKNIVWQYNFRDTITANSGPLDIFYGVSLMDTISLRGKNVLFCVAANENSFSSAIFQIDLKTGKRLFGTLWNSGHIIDGLFKDFDRNNKKELIAAFYNNGFEQVGVLAIELNELNDQCPTTIKYTYKNFPFANLKEYILFPKNDFAHYHNQRMEGIIDASIDHIEQEVIAIHLSPYYGSNVNYSYLLHYDLRNFDVVISNLFRSKRDSLVVNGKLKLPFSDTEEYCNILKSQIKYWNGKEFVFRKDLD